MYEAAFHGVPLVCIPFMGDQPDNAAKVRIVSKGMMTQCTVVATISVSLQLILISLLLHYMHHLQMHMRIIGIQCTAQSPDCLWCVLGLDKAPGDTSVRHRLQPKCPVPKCPCAQLQMVELISHVFVKTPTAQLQRRLAMCMLFYRSWCTCVLAAQVEYHGFGLTVTPERLTAPTLSAALQRVLQEPHFKVSIMLPQTSMSVSKSHACGALGPDSCPVVVIILCLVGMHMCVLGKLWHVHVLYLAWELLSVLT